VPAQRYAPATGCTNPYSAGTLPYAPCGYTPQLAKGAYRISGLLGTMNRTLSPKTTPDRDDVTVLGAPTNAFINAVSH
jgi:hypothetical protein